jgi:hypothetical protein
MKHPYALDENGKLIHINELERDKITKQIIGEYQGKQFYNLDGNKEQAFIPVLLGKKKHFRVKKEGEAPLLNEETYWHKAGKKLFEELYRESLKNGEPFYIPYFEKQVCSRLKSEFDIACHYSTESKKHDVTKLLTAIEVEQYDGELKPDIKIFNPNQSDKKIWIEIAHTSKVSYNKVEQGVRIVEIDIHNEADLENIRLLMKGERPYNVAFFNFNEKITKKAFCKEGGCKKDFIQFWVNNDKKPKIEFKPEHDLTKLNRNFVIWSKKELNSKFSQFRKDDIYRHFLGQAAKKNVPVKSCYLCTSHQPMKKNRAGENIFCKQKRTKCKSNKALECEVFLLSDTYVNEYLTLFNDVEKYQSIVNSREYYQSKRFKPQLQGQSDDSLELIEVASQIWKGLKKLLS